MLVPYGGASFSQSSQSELPYSPGLQFSPQQVRHDGYARVLQSTSENIRTPNHMSLAQNVFTKPKSLRIQPGGMDPRRLFDQLGLPDEDEIMYHAHAIKKVEKKEKGNPRPLSKVRETKKLWKCIPAAATTADCTPGSAYYKYVGVVKKETCKNQWCKDNDPHVLWSEEIEKSFQFCKTGPKEASEYGKLTRNRDTNYQADGQEESDGHGS